MVRVWTRVYTWHMRPDVRERRRIEIESDLWEFQRDPEAHRRVSPALHIAVRLVRGMPHDLRWRLEQADATRTTTRARQQIAGAVAVSATVAIVLGALWILPLLRPATLPRPLPNAFPLGQTQPPPPPCLPAEMAGATSTARHDATAR
jgi:hypothetical protein